MDKLHAMRALVAIADGGSLTRAAAALDSSLPAMVRTLAALERSLGVRLINRTTRRLAFTEEGREYLERCRRVIAEVDDAEAALTARQAEARGTLRITASVLFGRLHVAPLVAEFMAAHQRVRIELMLWDRVVDLLDEGLDLAVRIGALDDSSLVAIPVGDTQRVACASPAYLRAHGAPATPQALRDHSCIGFTSLAPTHEWDLRRDGRPVRVRIDGAFTTNQVDTAIDACERGLGVGFFLAYQIEARVRSGALRYVLGEFSPPAMPVHLVYPHARLLPSRVRSFLDWIAPRLRARLGGRR
jgi:DNA-binding transcriptional LysR family regulator